MNLRAFEDHIEKATERLKDPEHYICLALKNKRMEDDFMMLFDNMNIGESHKRVFGLFGPAWSITNNCLNQENLAKRVKALEEYTKRAIEKEWYLTYEEE